MRHIFRARPGSVSEPDESASRCAGSVRDWGASPRMAVHQRRLGPARSSACHWRASAACTPRTAHTDCVRDWGASPRMGVRQRRLGPARSSACYRFLCTASPASLMSRF